MPVDYYTPTEFSRYERAWYARPWFYLPLIVVVVLLLALDGVGLLLLSEHRRLVDRVTDGVVDD